MEGDGAESVKLNLDETHRILRIKEACEEDSEQQDGKQIDKLWRKTTNVRAKWSLKLTGGDGADGAVWDSSGHIDTNQIEEYKKAARNLGRDAGEKAPRFQ